jgi:phenylacetate-coenzyme A ligase PaaK-like adenylate-forming protein
MRIFYPQRESETVWVAGTPFNRVDVESGVFQRENMEYLTGEYEAFIEKTDDTTTMKLNLECFEPDRPGRKPVEERFTGAFLKYKPGLARAFEDDTFRLAFNFLAPGKLEFYEKKGRPKRLVDRR